MLGHQSNCEWRTSPADYTLRTKIGGSSQGLFCLATHSHRPGHSLCQGLGPTAEKSPHGFSDSSRPLSMLVSFLRGNSLKSIYAFNDNFY